jgi:hypothetical protein
VPTPTIPEKWGRSSENILELQQSHLPSAGSLPSGGDQTAEQVGLAAGKTAEQSLILDDSFSPQHFFQDPRFRLPPPQHNWKPKPKPPVLLRQHGLRTPALPLLVRRGDHQATSLAPLAGTSPIDPDGGALEDQIRAAASAVAAFTPHDTQQLALAARRAGSLPPAVRDVMDAWCVLEGSRTARWTSWQAGRVKASAHRQFERACQSDAFAVDGDAWLQAVAELPLARTVLLRRLFGGTQRLAPAATIAALRYGLGPYALSPIAGSALVENLYEELVLRPRVRGAGAAALSPCRRRRLHICSR